MSEKINTLENDFYYHLSHKVLQIVKLGGMEMRCASGLHGETVETEGCRREGLVFRLRLLFRVSWFGDFLI